VFGELPYEFRKVGFETFKTQHNKRYSSELENLHRFGIYSDNLQKIELLNQHSNGGAYFAINKFADLTAVEFRQLLGYRPAHSTLKERSYLDLDYNNIAPDSFDWASKDKVTPVKDQGQCGSCWAFSATENIESVWMIAKGLTPANFKPLSAQQIVDCDNQDAGCNGGDTITAYEYVISAGGQESEADYPYEATDEPCHFKAADVEVKISSYKYATKTKNEDEMKTATASISPLSICVDAEPWQFYASGVMMASQCSTDLDHCVQITGYDTSASTPFWKVRNSWGSDWGEKGFIRLQFGKNTCGVAEEATTAVV